jgi:integrase
VQALSPSTVEAMRLALGVRDATLVSVLAYAGLRPGEALGLRWGDIPERTLLVQRSVSLGEEADTKTRQQRTVRLLAPPAADLRAWRVAANQSDERELVFPSKDGQPGRRLRTNRGAGARSDALRVRPGPRMRVHMTYVIASLHCSCTRGAASSTLNASSATTRG